MRFRRMPIEAEAPEQLGYAQIRHNLAESSVRDRSLDDFSVDLGSQLLCYGDHAGHPGLRRMIAADAGDVIAPDDVLITAGAASALFVIATSLLEDGDHIIVLRPNYATNIETPRAIGCEVDYIDLRFDEGFRLDLDRLEATIRPDTKLVSLTTPHNPTGICLDKEDIVQILHALEPTSARLLIDETYGDMFTGSRAPVSATLSSTVVSVSSLSKTYGIPGVRIGWLICQDDALQHRFLCAKEQISICGSVIDEEIAHQAYAQRKDWLPITNARIAAARATVGSWIEQEPLVEWIEPTGGCVCFPRITAGAEIDVDRFYQVLNQELETYVGPGHWFEMPRRYFRIGYAWPESGDLATGLENISVALRRARDPQR